MRGCTPIATSTTSASSFSVFFSSFMSAMVTVAPDLPFSTAFTPMPSLKVMPWPVKDLSAAAEMSSSSTGRMRSCISTTVTLVPNAL